MFLNPRYRKPFIVALTISLLVLLIVFGTQYAQANKEAGLINTENKSDSPNGLDDSYIEFGMEWTSIYEGLGQINTFPSCMGFYDHLSIEPYIPNFMLGNYSSWEKDFKI